MTNANIIMNESFSLMEQGIIKGSGIFGETEDHKKVELPEAIHTYEGWKERGRQVKRGQHAVANFPIWKMTTKKAKSEEEEPDKKMYMVKAFFFTVDQTEEIKK
jgi:hypothetical protein